jgi:dipeptidyl aminopeptidase/acylaminoacyl peptidase
MRLGMTSGDFSSPGDARTMMLQGRYHDGHVKCTDDGSCHGFLLADYVHDFSGDVSQFFRRYQRDRPEPVTIISNTDTEGAMLLEHAHARLANYHIYEAQNVSYTGFEAERLFRYTDPPEFAVLATWNIGVSSLLYICRSF